MRVAYEMDFEQSCLKLNKFDATICIVHILDRFYERTHEK